MSRKQSRKAPIKSAKAASADAAKPRVEDLFAQAVALHAAGHDTDAEAYYRVILSVPPIQAEASYNLGLILQTRGHYADAVSAYRYAILLRNDYVDAISNMGAALQSMGNHQAAVDIYRQAIATRPDYAMAYCNLGVALNELRELEPSVEAYRRALQIKPDYDWAYANLSAVLLSQGKDDEAIAAARAAIAITFDMPIAHFNLGSIYKGQARLDEAAAAFRQSIKINPNFVEGHFTLSQVLLQQEKYEEGWSEYEWRWKLNQYSWLTNIHGVFSQPRWNGEPLSGKRILLYAEQGLGDALQYVRYVPFVQDRGGAVILAVHPPLKKLLGTIKNVELVTLDQVPLPPFDVHCPLVSLPLICQTRADSIPAAIPYLQADPAAVEQWRGRIAGDGLKVGIVWAGNPNQTGDRLRSPRLAAMKALFRVPGVRFVALQLGAGREDIVSNPLPDNVLDLGSEISDFSDTAAIMANLDLVITSCTAPLHLAGGLGVPTWGIIPFSPHFLWIPGRADSPWYPSLKLYKQDAAGLDWSGVMNRVADDLLVLAQAIANPQTGSQFALTQS